MTQNANRIQHSTSINTNINSRSESKTRFNLICGIEYGDNDDYMTDEVNVRIDWGVQSKTPLMDFLRELLKNIYLLIVCWFIRDWW